MSRLPSTERIHPRSEDLDLQSTQEVLARLHAEDLAAVRAVGTALPAVARAVRLVEQALRADGRLVYVGAGTSGRLGALDAAECPPTFGVSSRTVQAIIAGGPRALTRAVEGAEDDPEAGARAVRKLKLSSRDVVCGISASSTTPFVHGALREARQRGAATLLVCCNAPPAARRAADVVISLPTGPELVAGSTRLKAGTATKLVLNALSTATMVSLGKVYRGRMVELLPTNAKLKARAQRMVSELTGISPARARALLTRAKGSPRVALAMHFTGAGYEEALAQVRERGLRALER